jgi:modulator of FtsH protease
MGGWSDFFVAEVGASAALAGLVIVAISINLSRIVSFPWLPGRAAETLVAPTGVLVVSSYMLVPGQSATRLAGELIAAGTAMWLMPVIIQLRALGVQKGVPRRSLVVRFVLTQLSSVPVLTTGLLLLSGDADPIAWLVPGIIASLIATVINAWVLLVEIVR